MLKHLTLLLTVIVLTVGVGVADVSAQDAAATPTDAAAVSSGGPTFREVVLGGNAVDKGIWALLFITSFATVAFVFDGGISTRRDRLLPGTLVAGVRASLDQGDLGAAMAICEHNPGPLSNILLSGFSNISDGFEVVQDSVSAATDIESEKIMQRISYLNLCGQIGPMLGLLGTVTGMVSAFGSLAQASGATKDRLLALGISGALWTTVAGLLISIPAMLAFTLYKNFATRILLESEATVLDLIKILRNAEVEDDAEEFE